MGTWNSRGLRGSGLEELINLSNEIYMEKGLALVQKIPTPITPLAIDKNGGRITSAYFEKDSTVDYIGVVQGVAVCFDAKECSKDTFAMQNIHDHQIKFMENFEKQGGISFVILYYTHLNEMYYIPFCDMYNFYDRSKNGGRKSFRYEEINKNYKISMNKGVPVHYLEMISKDLAGRA